MRYIRKVLASIRKADELFSLVDKGDRILLGISGGKDSMCLLHAMHLYTKFSRKDFEIVPVCLDLGFDNFDPTPSVEYAKSLGLELIVSDSKEVYPILKSHTKPGGHIPCSICSRMKKAAINEVANRLHCNKVAFAHHRDDAIETLFMNMIHGSRVATFEPKMRLDRAGITFIRPFILARESDIIGMAKEENIPVMGKTCPADGYTERQFVKDELHRLYKLRPDAEENYAKMLYNYEPFCLYFHHVERPLEDNSDLTIRPVIEANDLYDYSLVLKKHPELPELKKENKNFLLKRKHKIVGSLSYRLVNAHQIEIVSFGIMEKSKDDAQMFLCSFMEMTTHEINPLIVVYKAKNKRLALKCGFKKMMLRGTNKVAYQIRLGY